VLFRILEYLLIGIFSCDIVHENPILSMCWFDIDYLGNLGYYICLCNFDIQLTAVIIPHCFWN
jgi:hypothetical protein